MARLLSVDVGTTRTFDLKGRIDTPDIGKIRCMAAAGSAG